MKRLLPIIFSITLAITSNKTQAQTETFEWVKQIEGIYPINATLDNQGNLLSIGYFKGTVDFDPSSNIQYLTANSTTYDSFIAKYTPEGNFIWAKQIEHEGSSDDLFMQSISLDQNSNIIIGGHYKGSIDINPGIDSIIFTNSANSSSFICKLDSVGNFIWANQRSSSRINSIAIDEDNNIYAGGSYSGYIDFDPDTSTSFLGTYSNENNSFITKFTPTGDFIWAEQFISDGSNSISSLTIDKSNNVITTGAIQDSVDFNPNPTEQYYLTSNGNFDIFICKLDSSGTFIWSKAIGGLESDESRYIISDHTNNIYITGQYSDSIDLDPGLNTHYVSPTGDSESFILKIDSLGEHIWSNAFHSSESILIAKITLDPLKNIYSTGHFTGTTDFDPGISTYNLNSSNSACFINKLNQDGSFDWSKMITSENGYSGGSSICVDDSFEVYTGGGFIGYNDFGIGTPNQILDGGSDASGFIHKISQPISTVSLSELHSESKYTLSPNPTSNFTQLFLGENSIHKIAIFNITGKKVAQFLYDKKKLTLDISNYKPGIYFIQIRGTAYTEVLKLVVNK